MLQNDNFAETMEYLRVRGASHLLEDMTGHAMSSAAQQAEEKMMNVDECEREPAEAAIIRSMEVEQKMMGLKWASPYLLFYRRSSGAMMDIDPVDAKDDAAEQALSNVSRTSAMRNSLTENLWPYEEEIYREFKDLPRTEKAENRVIYRSSFWNLETVARFVHSLEPGKLAIGDVLNGYSMLIRDLWMRTEFEERNRILIVNSFWWEKIKNVSDSIEDIQWKVVARRQLDKQVRKWYAAEGNLQLFEDIDVVYFPVHTPWHWSLGAMYIKDKQIGHWDSMFNLDRADAVIARLRAFVMYSVGEWWEADNYKDVYEQQGPTVDCGIWTAQCLLWQVMRVQPDFTRDDHIELLRKKMIIALLQGRILR